MSQIECIHHIIGSLFIPGMLLALLVELKVPVKCLSEQPTPRPFDNKWCSAFLACLLVADVFPPSQSHCQPSIKKFSEHFISHSAFGGAHKFSLDAQVFFTDESLCLCRLSLYCHLLHHHLLLPFGFISEIVFPMSKIRLHVVLVHFYHFILHLHVHHLLKVIIFIAPMDKIAEQPLSKQISHNIPSSLLVGSIKSSRLLLIKLLRLLDGDIHIIFDCKI